MRALNFRRPSPKPRPWAGKAAPVAPDSRGLTDLQILDILDRVERQGQSYEEAGAVHGKGRSATAGVIKRVRDDLAASEVGSRVTRADNQDGSQGPRWWAKAGSRRRAGARA